MAQLWINLCLLSVCTSALTCMDQVNVLDRAATLSLLVGLWLVISRSIRILQVPYFLVSVHLGHPLKFINLCFPIDFSGHLSGLIPRITVGLFTALLLQTKPTLIRAQHRFLPLMLRQAFRDNLSQLIFVGRGSTTAFIAISSSRTILLLGPLSLPFPQLLLLLVVVVLSTRPQNSRSIIILTARSWQL